MPNFRKILFILTCVLFTSLASANETSETLKCELFKIPEGNFERCETAPGAGGRVGIYFKLNKASYEGLVWKYADGSLGVSPKFNTNLELCEESSTTAAERCTKRYGSYKLCKTAPGAGEASSYYFRNKKRRVCGDVSLNEDGTYTLIQEDVKSRSLRPQSRSGVTE